MNHLVIPPSPNWYETNILACSKDNTIVYGSRTDLVIVKPRNLNEPANVQIILRAHREKIICVGVNPAWKDDEKFACSVGEDKVVKVWDVETCTLHSSHRGHTVSPEKVIAATFGGSGRIVSVAENGHTIIWPYAAGSPLIVLPDFFGSKVKVTSLSCCPHLPWMAAYGLKNGLVVIADLRQNGKILHKLRAHDRGVLSLSWCPTPHNILPTTSSKPIERSKMVKHEDDARESSESSTGDTHVELKLTIKKGPAVSENKILESDEENLPGSSVVAVEKTAVTEKVKTERTSIHRIFPIAAENRSSSEITSDEFLAACNSVRREIMQSMAAESARFGINVPDSSKIKKYEQRMAERKSQPESGAPVEQTESEITDIGEVLPDVVENLPSSVETNQNDECSPVRCFAQMQGPPCTALLEARLSRRMEQNIAPVEPRVEQIEGLPCTALLQARLSRRMEQNIAPLEPRVEQIEGPPCTAFLQARLSRRMEQNIAPVEPRVEQIVASEQSESDTDDVDEVLPTTSENVPAPDKMTQCVAVGSPIGVDKILQNYSTEKTDTSSSSFGAESNDSIKFDTAASNDGSPEAKKESITQEHVKGVISDIMDSVIDLHVKNKTTKEQEKLQKDICLLASSARGGRSICIWRVKPDGRLVCELTIPNKNNHRQKRSYFSDRSWITIFWNTPYTILSSSPVGELFEWDLREAYGKRPSLKPKLIHHDHNYNLFCIAAPITCDMKVGDWKDRVIDNLNAWTIGQDRYILNTNLGPQREIIISYPTLGGMVYCLTASPLVPTRVALGIADGTARVWDLSKPHFQYITMTHLWQKIQSRVLTLAWHPAKETILAYGTLEGRIGLVDTGNISKAPVLMSQSFKSGIYHLEFGPLENDGTKDYGLYACSEGKLVVYNTSTPHEDPKAIETVEYVTQFSWKKDYKILAVGYKTGTISFHYNSLTSSRNVYFQQKSVQAMVWHPESANCDESEYSGYLAVATNDTSVVVYDVRNTTYAGSGDNADGVIAVLNKHLGAVKALAWSPFHPERLVSVGEDGLAQVWDVQTKTVISTYYKHYGEPISAVMWSPLMTGYIITAAKDMTIRSWDLTFNSPVENIEELVQKIKKRNSRHEKEKPSTDENIQQIEIVKTKKVNRDLMLSSTSKLPNNTAISMLDDCERLFEINEKKSDDFVIDVLGLFGDKNDTMKFLEAEQRSHANYGKFACVHHISLWKGDINQTIKNAIKTGNVTPWLISIAPMVSVKLWQECCEVYAQKQSENPGGDPIETASYYLACHKIEAAIDVLCKATLFREALSLAKCRLAANDPLIAQVLKEWAQYATVTGNFELAAECFLAMGQYEEAAKVLFRRSDVRTLELAAKLADKTDNKDLQHAVHFRYNAFKKAEIMHERVDDKNGNEYNNGEDDSNKINISNGTEHTDSDIVADE